MCQDLMSERTSRRNFIASVSACGFLLTPLAALLAGCGNKTSWPEGMAEIKWDRDTCVRCNMVISDRRFAAQTRGGPNNTVLKFDDIGCLIFWEKEKVNRFPWLADPATRHWVADYESKSREEMRWLDPKQASFVSRTSPMGYNLAAVSSPLAGALDFNAASQNILAKGK